MLAKKAIPLTLAGGQTAGAAPHYRRHFRFGLTVKLALAFIGLVSLVLAVSGGLDMWLGYDKAKQVAVQMQQEKARDAAGRITEFVSDIETQLGWTTPLQWDGLPLEQRRYDLVRLLREVPAISDVAEIDGQGKQRLKLSRTAPDMVDSNIDLSSDPCVVQAEKTGVCFGPVYFRNQSEPFMTIAVKHDGHQAGVTLANIDLRFIWDLIGRMHVGRTGYAYVVDHHGRLIADPDPNLVLRNTDWAAKPQVKAALASLNGGPPVATGQIAGEHDGSKELTVFAPVRRLDWAVFVETSLGEALAPVYASLYRVATLLALGLLLAAGLGTVLARRMVVPIRRLQDGADRLGSGELSAPIVIHTGDEIEILAERFNQMAAKVRESYETLEAKVEARTVALQTSEQSARDARLAAEHALADLRQAQDRLVETQKLAALGQLTAGIAHEIKNPLNFVNNFAELSGELITDLHDALAAENATLSPETRAEIEDLAKTLSGNLAKIVEHGRRADSIVKNMLMHSRSGGGERRSTNLNALVAEALNLAYHGARAEHPDFNVTLRRDLDPGVGECEVYPQELTRVLLNLFSNGLYALRQRQRGAPGPGYLPALSVATRALADRIEIRVHDNGTGIPEPVREKIFNPFFTTKPAGEGTGLGLSLSHDIIVNQHGGTFDVETKSGDYTEFIVTLPCPMAAADAGRGGEG
ncbi:MAG TPA: ATP-binding protein [Stellaceae bacterium]|nr:ATP-binding protein [Stellaceae bacterium]